MRIKFVEVSNFRKLKATHIDFDDKTTIFVGANNSGKTSAMVALRYFLLSPARLALRDVTIANWTKIDSLGDAWESATETEIQLESLLPALDLWLDVPVSEIQHVVHILPTLDWNGGRLGVRLQYRVSSLEKMKAEYLLHRESARHAVARGPGGEEVPLHIWPRCLTDFLEGRIRAHIELQAFVLDPLAFVVPSSGYAHPQLLPELAMPLDKAPFKGLIKIDEIAAQRDFADASERSSAKDEGNDPSIPRFKRRLSEQLRAYYDRHLDPSKTPTDEDFEALGAIQVAEKSFDKRLEVGFADAFAELEDLGYPGITNPKLKISTLLHAMDGLKHGSAVQYQVADPSGDGSRILKLPEDYSGLGYQNLIAMVFMLMGYRDEWMRVGKASKEAELRPLEQIPLLHLVLVEEPEAHLHAQVQQVFINKAYKLLRKHDDLGEKTSYQTQLVVSTHSSHVAHEVDFSNLRYFRRRAAVSKEDTPTTTVANLSYVFGPGDETKRFVRRYLKATHCDLFFADGIIFVEGQAERILVPHFIRHHFPDLSRRYTTLLDLGGSHAHSFKELVDELGLTTLIIGDLDAVVEVTVNLRAGGKAKRWKGVMPKRGANQKTANPVLKSWHPGKENIDDLLALKPREHISVSESYRLYVAYQRAVSVGIGGGKQETVTPRTFEDALIMENREVVATVEGSPTSDKIKEILQENLSGEELEDELFELLKKAEKAAFALDCLMLENPKALRPPEYIRAGLEWFQGAVSREISDSEPEGPPA